MEKLAFALWHRSLWIGMKTHRSISISPRDKTRKNGARETIKSLLLRPSIGVIHADSQDFVGVDGNLHHIASYCKCAALGSFLHVSDGGAGGAWGHMEFGCSLHPSPFINAEDESVCVFGFLDGG